MNPLGSVPGVARGCGYRTEGAVYLETGTAPFGQTPIWIFISDPPVPYTAPHALGVDVVEIDGTPHIINHVGAKYWRSPADFIEEGIRYGFSTRVPKMLDLSVLTPASRMIHVHPKGALMNPGDFSGHVRAQDHVMRCAKQRTATHVPSRNVVEAIMLQDEQARQLSEKANWVDHIKAPGKLWPTQSRPAACNFYHWAFALPTSCTVHTGDGELVEQFDQAELQKLFSFDSQKGPRVFLDFFRNPAYRVHFTRQGNDHGTNNYRVYPVLDQAAQVDARWESAMIAALPITNISVIRADDGSHLKTLADKQHQAGSTFSVTEASA